MKLQNYFPSQGLNSPLMNNIIKAEERLSQKLRMLNHKSLAISDYNKRYLDEKLRDGALDVYCQILYLSLCKNSIPLKDITLIDYGGGCGVMSYFAKDLGIGTVIYNDIYDVSCSDVRVTSKALGLNVDHIVCGDVNDLIMYIKENNIKANVIVSYDVLEHIYNLNDHFSQLSKMANRFKLVYGSSANIKNPRIVKRIKKLHLESEYMNRNKVWGHKERDALRAYIEIRKEMIKTYSPDLENSVVDKLSRMTRGLSQAEINKSVDEYKIKGTITYKPDHPTNTCDPYNGNWKEHLIDHDWLISTLKKIGYEVDILHGYYNLSGSKLKRSSKAILNNTLRILGKKALFISPHILVCADFKNMIMNTGNYESAENKVY